MRALSVALLLLLAAGLGVPMASADDPDPPEFKGVTVRPGVYGPGDDVPMEVHWEDASGLQYISAQVIGPAELNLWVQCDDPEEDRVAKVDCLLRLPARAPGGTYKVASSWAQDVVGHTNSAQTDVKFTVESPFNDREGPTLVSATQNVTTIDMLNVTHEWNYVRLAEAFVLTASDASNLTYAGMQFEGPNRNSGMWVQCDRVVDADLTCMLYADPEIPAGDYVLRNIYLQDEIGYMSYYHYNGWYQGQWKDLSQVLPTPFRVTVDSPYGDDDAPVLTGLTFPGRLHRGQPFEVRINATDATAVEQVSVYFRTTRGNAGYSVSTYAACEGDKDSDAQLVCTGRFPDNFPLGLALVDWVNVVDQGQNWGWLRPIEVGNGWGPPETQFRDDDTHDVGTILVPRPIEGVLEAIDAVVNEVLPGDVATLVYEVEDTVDDVELVLEDAADGSTVAVDCVDAILTRLGTECTFEVPASENGVLSLVSATTTSEAGVEETSTYAAGAVPLLAVTGEIPAAQQMALALGGGALNTVGHDWAAELEAAKSQAAQGADVGPTSAPPVVTTSEPSSTSQPEAAPAPPQPVQPDPTPYVSSPRTYTATTVNAVPEQGTPSPSMAPWRPDEDSGEPQPQPEQDVPLPLSVSLLALALGFLLRRRRA